jgi:squalene cyclase
MAAQRNAAEGVPCSAVHPAIERGIRYLLDTQNPDGSWDEPEFTGTGFPRVFYLRYHYYRIYFPLLALTTFAQRGARNSEGGMKESREQRAEVR